MSRDIRINLDKDQLESILKWETYYDSQMNCDIEINLIKE